MRSRSDLLTGAVDGINVFASSRLGLRNRVVFLSTLSTGQSGVSTWTRGVALESGIVIVVCSLAQSVSSSKLLVSCAEL